MKKVRDYLKFSRVKLKKNRYKRDRHRELLNGGYFNRAETSVSWLLRAAITIFFTPIIAATSLLSQTTLVVIINITLAFGYISNFFYKMLTGEMSWTEGILTVFGLALAIGLAIYFTPMIIAPALSITSILLFSNLIALAINAFFLIKHVALPPMITLMSTLLRACGFKIEIHYYYRTPLNLKTDRFILDLLCHKYYKHNTSDPNFKPEELKPFHHLQNRVIKYINKYNGRFFGNIIYQKKILHLEQSLDDLTTKADATSSLSFIHRKLSFKQTKVNLLKDRQLAFQQAKDNADVIGYNKLIKKEIHGDKIRSPQELSEHFDYVNQLFKHQIARQEKKMKKLKACCPPH